MPKDISESEEAHLPLPDGWIKILRVNSGIVYKDAVTNNESDEHPFILEALNAARKLKLPVGWAVKEAMLEDGTYDYYYANAELGISLWDPPLLRHCLADILGSHGHSASALWILSENEHLSPPAEERQQLSLSPISDDIYNQSIKKGQDYVSSAYDRFRSLNEGGGEFGSLGDNFGRNDDDVDDVLFDEFSYDNYNNNSYNDSKSGGRYNNNNNRSYNNYDDDYVENTHDPEQQYDEQNSKQKYLKPPGDKEDLTNAVRSSSDNISNNISNSNSNSNNGSPASGQSGNSNNLRTIDVDLYNISPVKCEDNSIDGTNTSDANPYNLGPRKSIDAWKQYQLATKAMPNPNEKLVKNPNQLKSLKSLAGLKVLKSDCQSANVRIHELLVRLRASLCEQSNVPFKIIDSFQDTPSDLNAQMSEESKNNYSGKTLLRQAAAIISQLFCNPDRLVSMLANVLKPSDSVLVYAVFIILHRLLHPLSSDNSLTSAFVLKTLNFQIEEIGQINEIFPDNDSKSIIARALFIKDPETAFNWDPLAQPLPVFPNLAEETLLASVLRVYSIRRDVTSYFRTTWRPALPSVLSLLSSPKDMSGRDIFINLVTSAFRILDCTFSEQAIMAFPVTATAVCRSLYEIGGSDALHFYMLNFLVLPNLLKILTGDHESIENEITYNNSTLNEMLNAYFDFNAWWPAEGFSNFNDFSSLLVGNKLTVSLIWLVWRLFSGAAFLSYDEKGDSNRVNGCIKYLTSKAFFDGGPDHDLSGVSDTRVRYLVKGLKTKLDLVCKKILQLPLDKLSSEFLGENQAKSLKSMANAPENSEKMIEYRLMSLLFKPEEMMSFTIITRRELAFLLHNVGLDLELSKVASNSELYRSISEFLFVNEYVEEDVDIEFLVVPFKYEENLPSEETQIGPKHDQYMRGMKFLTRYEDSLLRMVDVVESSANNRLENVLSDKQWYIAPEFDANLEIKEVALFQKEKETESFKPKHKQSHLGLVNSFNAVDSSTDIIHVPEVAVEFVSLRNIQEQVQKGLRFGSSKPVAAVGTSIARQTSKPPVVKRFVGSHPEKFDVNTTNRTQEFVVTNDKGFLQDTKTRSSRPTRSREKASLSDLHNKFKKGLRGYEVTSTDEFLAKRSQNNMLLSRQLGLRNSLMMSPKQLYDSPTKSVSSSSQNGQAAQPFPDHLRNRIRPQSSNNSSFHDNSRYPQDINQNYHIANTPTAAVASNNALGNGADDIRAAIQAYQRLTFSNNRFSDYIEKQQFDNLSSPRIRSFVDTSPLRSRSPRVPDPLPGIASTFMQPTKNIQNNYKKQNEDEEKRISAENAIAKINPNYHTPFLPSGVPFTLHNRHASPSKLGVSPPTSSPRRINRQGIGGAAVAAALVVGGGGIEGVLASSPSRKRSASPASKKKNNVLYSENIPNLKVYNNSIDHDILRPEEFGLTINSSSNTDDLVGFNVANLNNKDSSKVSMHQGGEQTRDRQNSQASHASNGSKDSKGLLSSKGTKVGSVDVEPASDNNLVSGEQKDDYNASTLGSSTTAKQSAILDNKEDLMKKLQEGVSAVKYSTSSYPKSKIVSFSKSTSELVWDALPGEKKNSITQLFKGSSNAINIRSIQHINLGLFPKALQSAKAIDSLLCLSIEGKERALNLSFPSNTERDNFVKALVFTLDSYGINDVKVS